MDVPTWHPANNEDQKKDSNASTNRTEFKVMNGSSIDTSTEAGKILMQDVHGEISASLGGIFDNRGKFDPSDRLYLNEQEKLRKEKEHIINNENQEALRSFRQQAVRLNDAALTSGPILALPPKQSTTSIDPKVPHVSIVKKKKSSNDKLVKAKGKPKTKKKSNPIQVNVAISGWQGLGDYSTSSEEGEEDG